MVSEAFRAEHFRDQELGVVSPRVVVQGLGFSAFCQLDPSATLMKP